MAVLGQLADTALAGGSPSPCQEVEADKVFDILDFRFSKSDN